MEAIRKRDQSKVGSSGSRILFVTALIAQPSKIPADDFFMGLAIQISFLEPILIDKPVELGLQTVEEMNPYSAGACQCYAGITHARGRKEVQMLARI